MALLTAELRSKGTALPGKACFKGNIEGKGSLGLYSENMIKFDDETPAKSNSNFKRSDALRPRGRRMYILYLAHPRASDREKNLHLSKEYL